MSRLALTALAAAALATGCATTPPADAPATVASVDLARYAGTWYEIASFPNPFQKGCTATTATYTPAEDGTITVLNRCRQGDEIAEIEGSAKVVAGSDNTRLKVRFFGPFGGDYWVLALDDDYRWALVGTPSRKYLWVLAREPELDADTYATIVAQAAAKGFDTSRLNTTDQSAPLPPPAP